MTIKQRLAMFVIMAIVFIVLSAGVAWYFFDVKIGLVNSYKDEIAVISNQIGENRVLEKRYLQFLKPELKSEFNGLSATITQNLQQIRQKFAVNESQTDEILGKYKVYSDKFTQVGSLIDSNLAFYKSSLEPLLNSRGLVKEFQETISARQLELQFEGEDLSSNEIGIIILANECSTVLFKLQSLQQEFLRSGNEDKLEEMHLILDKEASEISAGIHQFFRILENKDLMAKSSELINNFKNFAQSIDKLKSCYESEQTAIKELDEAGTTLVLSTGLLRNSANKMIADEKEKAFSYLGTVLGFSIFIFFAFSIFIAIRITRPINEVTTLVKEIAKGNLNVEITHRSNDEIGVMTAAFEEMIQEQRKKIVVAQSISEGDFTSKIDLSSQEDTLGQAFNHMSGSLADVLTNINVCANNVSVIAKRVYDGSEQLSGGSVRSASSLEELSSSLSEIGGQVKSNAESAQIASKTASEAMASANKGNERMNEMSLAMEEIRSSSDKIRSILKVIEDIAFQTNLLALNAAVEAARAGRHGKGFAVVADEVRNLAARSAKAVKETSDLIEDSSNMVDQGAEITRKTAEALSEIVKSITETSELVEKISKASSEQSTGVSEINVGLEQIDKVTQQNAAEAEKSLSDAENLSEQAEKLQHLLSKFVLPDD